MVQSAAATVDDYIAEADPGRAPYLTALRGAARALLPGRVEAMRWGMPTYYQGDDMVFAFASQKQYLAVYGLGTAAREMAPEALAGLDHGKGCIRFRNPAKMDMNLIGALLRHTAERGRSGC